MEANVVEILRDVGLPILTAVGGCPVLINEDSNDASDKCATCKYNQE